MLSRFLKIWKKGGLWFNNLRELEVFLGVGGDRLNKGVFTIVRLYKGISRDKGSANTENRNCPPETKASRFAPWNNGILPLARLHKKNQDLA